MKPPREPKSFTAPRLYFSPNAIKYQGDLHIVYPDGTANVYIPNYRTGWYVTHYRDYHPTDVVKGLKVFSMMNGLELIYVGEVK